MESAVDIGGNCGGRFGGRTSLRVEVLVLMVRIEPRGGRFGGRTSLRARLTGSERLPLPVAAVSAAALH